MLLESLGPLDPKHCKRLAEQLQTMQIMRGELLARGAEALSAELLFGLGQHAAPDKTRLSIVSTKFLGDDTGTYTVDMKKGDSVGGQREYENELFGRDAVWPSELEDIDFTDCELVGCELRSVRLRRCRFLDCRFERVDASATDWTDCTLRGVTFHDSKLLGINFTILDGANFNGADLTQADFTRSTGLSLSPGHARMKGTVIEMDVLLRMAEELGLKVVGY